MNKVSIGIGAMGVTENPYEKNPLSMKVLNAFTSKLIREVKIPSQGKIRGGKALPTHKSKTLQLGDLSIFDKNIDEIKEEKVVMSVDGDPQSIMIYPYDNIVSLREKIYVATGIPPFRQHLLLKDNAGSIKLSYQITVSGSLLDINIFNELQCVKTNTILNIPIDTDVVARKTDINIAMMDMTYVMLMISGHYITEVLICDLFDILNPNNSEVEQLMQSEQQRELIYYGFIIKYFPILPYEGMVQVYEKKDDISYLYPCLKQPYTKLRSRFQQEKTLMNTVYDNMKKSLTYIKSITKRDIYFITRITAATVLPTVDVRNIFDNFELTKKYVYAAVKLRIGNSMFWVEKKFILYTDHINISMNNIDYDMMLIQTVEGDKIYISRNNITVETRYGEPDKMTFEDVNETLHGLIGPIITEINKLGVLIIEEGDIIDVKHLLIQTNNSNVEASWPENCTSDQFSKLREVLQLYEDADILNVKSASVGQYDITMMAGVSCCTSNRLRAIMSQIPDTTNQYNYYSNLDVRHKWNEVARNTISIVQKASNLTLLMNGFSKLEFQMILPIMLSLLYLFSSKVCGKMIIKDTEKITKRLKKLKGIDPDLYLLRRYDSNVAVYSVKCQADRQPVIYKTQELRNLSQTIKNRLIKFWNFTEQKPVYYDCPNRTYPHLSFRPHDHPLGYCLPCCKKLVPSEDSRQAKIDEICHEKFIIPPGQMEEIIKKLDKEHVHILSYGKTIPVDRFSYISPLIENNILMAKTKYRLLGVPQNLPLMDDAGFIFSLLYILDVPMDKFAKDITKIITKDIFGILDEGHTAKFQSPDELKETIINMLVDTTRSSVNIDLHTIDWYNVISELVYMVYGIHFIILNDCEGELKVRMLATTQVALLQDCDENKFAIVVAHDNGIYPLIEVPKTIIFNCKNDDILTAIKEIVKTEINKTEYIGITLNNILAFIKDQKGYSVKALLLGKRGMVYAVNVRTPSSGDVYVPCIYTEYLTSKYKIEDRFPDLDKFKREDLYDFIDKYNNFIIRTHKSKSNYELMLIDPVGVLKHDNKYIGLRIRFVYDKYGMIFHHMAESTLGRYNVKSIDAPYNIASINDAISEPSSHEITPNITNHAYHNYIYSLFLAEFAYEIRKYKNIPIRKALEENLHKFTTNVKMREIRHILDKYPSDYQSIAALIARHTPKKVIDMIQHTIFDFDLIGLKKIRDMKPDKRYEEIEKIMKKYVIIVPKSKMPGISNTIVSCSVDKDLPQCDKGKLMLTADAFKDCCKYLVRDLEVPYLFETISFRIIDIRNKLKFQRRKSELLSVKEIE